MSIILDSEALRELKRLLGDALNSARMTTAGFGFPNDRVIAAYLHMGDKPGTEIKQGDVLHPTRYIVEMTRIYRESWIIGPLVEVMGKLGLQVPDAGVPSPDSTLPTEDCHPYYIRKSWKEAEGFDRVRFAEDLIKQLPEPHDGRNTWLMHYGSPEVAEPLRIRWSERNGRPWTATTDGSESLQVVDAEFVDPAVDKPAPKVHPHDARIKEWLDDTSREIWLWNTETKAWHSVGLAAFDAWPAGTTFVIGEKPDTTPEPAARMCTLAGVEFPAPLSEAPEMRRRYWIAKPTGTADSMHWDDMPSEGANLLAGLIHATPEAADQHSKALLAANKQAIEAAK